MAQTDPTDDEELFRGVQERDPTSWVAFVERFGALVASVPRKAGLSEDDVEDVVQATWLQLLRHAPLIRQPKSVPSWVLTTATRHAWRVGSRGRSRRDVEERAGTRSAEEREDSPPELDLVRLENVQAVRDGLARLGDPCGALLRALFLERETPSYERIAAALGIAVGSIGPTRQRCLGKLAADLERNGFQARLDS